MMRAVFLFAFSSDAKSKVLRSAPSSPTWQNGQRTPSPRVKPRMICVTCWRVRSFGRTCRFFGGGCGPRSPPGAAPCGGWPGGGWPAGGWPAGGWPVGGCWAAIARVTENRAAEQARMTRFMATNTIRTSPLAGKPGGEFLQGLDRDDPAHAVVAEPAQLRAGDVEASLERR